MSPSPLDHVSDVAQTVQRAMEIFACQHDGRDPMSAWPCPDHEDNLLASCEWRLWEAYKGCIRSHQDKDDGPSMNGFTKWILGFYIKLATSPDLQRVCADRCRSRAVADALLGLLFWEADRFRPDGRTSERPFTRLMGAKISREQAAIEVQERRKARADLRQFTLMYQAVERLSSHYFEADREELRTVIAKHERPAEAYANPSRGPDQIIIRLGVQSVTIAPSPQEDDEAREARKGRDQFGGSSTNTYAELVRRLVKRAYRGQDLSRTVVAIIQHFSPGLLPDSYGAKTYPNKDEFSSRLAKYMRHPRAQAYVKSEEAHFIDHAPLTKILRRVFRQS